MRTAAGRRHFTLIRGRNAERVALLWLVLRGWRPLARRYAAGGGEIDLVMRRGDVLAFVEVKARASLDAARTAIEPAKRRKIGKAARTWLARHPAHAGLVLRGDAVFLAPGQWPLHVAAAYELDLGSA